MPMFEKTRTWIGIQWLDLKVLNICRSTSSLFVCRVWGNTLLVSTPSWWAGGGQSMEWLRHLHCYRSVKWCIMTKVYTQQKSMILISFQEVKVQVISAEKCQSWFKQAHRWECSLFASWLPSLSCSFSSVSWPQSSSIICWRSNARNVRLLLDHKTHFYRSLKFSV